MRRNSGSLIQIPLILAGVVAGLAILFGVRTAHAAQTSALQDRLTEAKAVSCSFTLVTTATWTKGVASAATTPIKYAVGFKNIKVDEGSADAESQFGDSFIVVRQAGDYLHLIQSYRSGPLYTTTVFARESSGGRFIAVHTRHEFTDVSLPGITSRPEMYVGDCAVTP
jgi:hypothetical protein